MTLDNLSKLRYSIIWFRGAPYLVDRILCRKALVRRQLEGELDNMTSLAVAASVSRSTASRMFSGRSVSLAALLRMLKVLRLEFDEVCTPATDEDIAKWEVQQEEHQRRQQEQRKERRKEADAGPS